MFEEPAQKELVRQSHHSLLAVTSVVLPAESDVGVGDVDKPMVGDRDPMRVASQIMQDMFGTAERRLGIDHPIFPKQGAEKSVELLLLCQRKACAKEHEFAPAKSALQAGHKLSTKDAAQNLHGQKESRRRADPLFMILRQPAARHNTVDVWMPLQGLAPGVENAQEADLSTEMFGFSCDFQQRL